METSIDRHAERWYILCYAGNQKSACQRLSSIENLQFYAPVFFLDQHNISMREAWAFRNYAFIYGSQNYIYQLKKTDLTTFNFMPSCDKSCIQHPYVTDFEIEQLRKVEKMNNGWIPLTLSTEDVIVGDTVEILTGSFKGLTATAVTKNGSKYRQLYLYISHLLVIPLCKLKKEEFRIISHADQTKQSTELSLTGEETSHIVNALKRHYGMLPSSKELRLSDESAMKSLIEKCKSIATTSANTRIRAYTLMAVAHAVMGNEDICYRNIDIAKSLLSDSITKSTSLFFTTLRYLCTDYVEHHNDFILCKQDTKRSISQSQQSFIDLADQLWEHQEKRRPQKTSFGNFTGDQNLPYWFCLSAPKKKTEAVRLFRDSSVPTYLPIVTDSSNRTKDSKKNILKDFFFVKTTFANLLSTHLHHPLFTPLTTSASNSILTYTDDDITTFDYVNSLNLPNKEIQHFTADQESRVSKSQKRTMTLGDRTIEGRILSSHIGNRTQEKMLFLLPGVAAISLRLD